MKLKLILAASAVALAVMSAAGAAAAQSWTQLRTYSPSGGPVAASANPGSLYTSSSNLLTDVVGGVWMISSSNYASANSINSTADELAWPSSDNAVNEKQCIDFYAGTSSVNSASSFLRWNGSTTSPTGYSIGISANGSVWVAQAKVSGVPTTLALSGTTPTLTTGIVYTSCASVVQSGSSTVLVETIAAASTPTTILATGTATDNTSALQNVSGQYAIVEYTPSAGPTQLSKFTTYSYQVGPATSYLISGPTSGPAGVSSGTFFLTTDGTVSSPIHVTISDDGGGGMVTSGGVLAATPAIITVPTNGSAQSTVSFSYTPPTAQNYTLSFANDADLTDPANESYQALNAIPASSNAFSFSPGTWSCLRLRPCLPGITYPTSWNIGANFTIVWNASASPVAQLVLASPSSTHSLSCFLNGKLTDNIAADQTVKLTSAMGLMASAQNTLTCYLSNFTTTNPFAGGSDVVVESLEVDGASQASAAPDRQTKGWIELVGDSITCGWEASGNLNSYQFIYSHSYMLMQELHSEGFDVALSCMGGSGYLTEAGNVPAYYYYGAGQYSGSLSRWSLIDANVSLLDTLNGHISAYGAPNTEPVAILVDYGANDVTYAANVSYLQSSVQGTVTALHSAAPAAKILIIYELALEAPNWCFLGTHTCSSTRTGYVSAIMNGVASAGISNAAFIDLGADLASRIYNNPTVTLSDGITHPNAVASGWMAPAYSDAIQQALGLNDGKALAAFRDGFFH